MNKIVIIGNWGYIGSSITRAFMNEKRTHILGIELNSNIMNITAVPSYPMCVQLYNHDNSIDIVKKIKNAFHVNEKISAVFYCAGKLIPSYVNNKYIIPRNITNKSFLEIQQMEHEKLLYAIKLSIQIDAKYFYYFYPQDEDEMEIDIGNNLKKEIHIIKCELPITYGIYQQPLSLIVRIIMDDIKYNLLDMDSYKEIISIDTIAKWLVENYCTTQKSLIKIPCNLIRIKDLCNCISNLNQNILVGKEIVGAIGDFYSESYKLIRYVEFYKRNKKIYQEMREKYTYIER